LHQSKFLPRQLPRLPQQWLRRCHSAGTMWDRQIWLQSLVKYGTAASPYFNNSGCISSTAAALPFFNFLMALMTSSWEMSCMLTSKLLCSCSSFSDADGFGQFSTSWKWTVQRFISLSCVLANLPLASFMCVLWILCPVSSLTMSKRRFESPVFAAFSASFALSLNHCCLSALHLFWTSLSFSFIFNFLLFLRFYGFIIIYINNLVECCSSGWDIFLFADDAKLLKFSIPYGSPVILVFPYSR